MIVLYIKMDKVLALKNYESARATLDTHLQALAAIVQTSGELLEGNSFYYHQSLFRFEQLFTKQVNLFWFGSQASARICEIGFNAGHSSLLMLLGRNEKPVILTVFDIGEHKYTRPAIEYVRAHNPNTTMEFIEGDSTQTMPLWIQAHPECVGQYDVIHVDGGHSEHCIRNDIQNAFALAKIGAILIIDDISISYINDWVNIYIASGLCEEVEVFPTQGYPHRILRKIQNGMLEA